MIVYQTSEILKAKDTEDNTVNLRSTGIEQNELKVINLEQEDVLYQVLMELKKMNLHLSLVTENTISNTEV